MSKPGDRTAASPSLWNTFETWNKKRDKNREISRDKRMIHPGIYKTVPDAMDPGVTIIPA